MANYTLGSLGRTIHFSDDPTKVVATVTTEDRFSAAVTAANMAARWNALLDIDDGQLERIAKQFPNDLNARRRLLINLLRTSLSHHEDEESNANYRRIERAENGHRE